MSEEPTSMEDIVGTQIPQWSEEYEPENPDVPVDENEAIQTRLNVIEAKLEALVVGVNTIGEMMNAVQQGFEEVMTRVNSSGGIAGLLGGLMGGGKNG